MNIKKNIIRINKVYQLSEALKVYEKIKNAKGNNIILDFSKSPFIQNQFYAIFGLALKKFHSDKKIKIIPPTHYKANKNIKNIGFLKEFNPDFDGEDIFETMVRYTHIPLDKQYKSEEFFEYFFERFNNVIKNLSPKLLKEINRAISELFTNVFMHSKSKLGLFCVGQFYPNKDKFSFIIADGGVGIKYNVENYLNKKITDIEALKWAITEGHSTSGGGFGLNLVIDLVTLQKGRFDIISGKGRIKINNGKKEPKILPQNFEGTIVYIELKTDNYYKLKGEK
jgi:anti-sigma regulatory factor (Ser/Thr protein kinase)